MVNGFARKLEIAANVAIIVVTILLATVLIKNYLLNRDKGLPFVSDQLHAGTKLNFPNLDWSKDKLTLVIALSTTCHFCSESAGFYQKLAKDPSHVRLVGVLPQTVGEAQKYLEGLRVSVSEIKQLQLSSLGVNGTPTLILVDHSGTVVDIWAGKLTSNEEVQVLDRLGRTTN